jgi:PAS domain S-box-containing protein
MSMSARSVDPLSAATDLGSDAELVRAGSADPLANLVDLARTPTLQVALRAIRDVLAMDVAYVSEIVGDDLVVRDLEGDGSSFRLATEGSLPRAQTYGQLMLDGRIPNLIPDVLADDRTASLPITKAGNVGAFASVPLTFGDGRVYGTLCAASHDAKSFTYQDLQFLKVFARLVADQLERNEASLEISELVSLVNAADDAIIGLTVAGVVTSWNDASERIFGYPASEAIGYSIIELIAPPGNEDGMRRALAKAAAGELVHREVRHRRADGSIIVDAMTLSPIRDQRGEVSFISAVSRDSSAAVFQAHYRAIEQEVVSSLENATDAAEAALGTLRGVGHGLHCEIAALWEPDESRQKLRCSALWVSEQSTDTPFTQALRADRFDRGEELAGRIWAPGSRYGSGNSAPGQAGVSIAAKPWPGDLIEPRCPWDDDHPLE